MFDLTYFAPNPPGPTFDLLLLRPRGPGAGGPKWICTRSTGWQAKFNKVSCNILSGVAAGFLCMDFGQQVSLKIVDLGVGLLIFCLTLALPKGSDSQAPQKKIHHKKSTAKTKNRIPRWIAGKGRAPPMAAGTDKIIGEDVLSRF